MLVNICWTRKMAAPVVEIKRPVFSSRADLVLEFKKCLLEDCFYSKHQLESMRFPNVKLKADEKSSSYILSFNAEYDSLPSGNQRFSLFQEDKPMCEGEIITKPDPLNFKVKSKIDGFADDYNINKKFVMRFKYNTVSRDRVLLSLEQFAKDGLSAFPELEQVLLGGPYHHHKAEVESPTVDIPELNEEQRSGVSLLRQNKIVLIVGPPGTGKTFFLSQVLQDYTKDESKTVLALAQSNFAVENLVNMHKDSGTRLVRVVSRSRERLTTENESLCVHTWLNGGKSVPDWVAKILESNKGKKEDRLEELILKSAQIIACTTIMAFDRRIKHLKFNLVILDEASTLPICNMIPLLMATERLLFVGDPKQLPPVVAKPRLAQSALSLSILDLLLSVSIPSVQFKHQFRMPAEMARFVSKAFYAGTLITDQSTKFKSSFPGIKLLRHPIAVFLHNGIDTPSNGSQSRCNTTEAECVLSAVKEFINQGQVSPEKMVIITSYNGQRRMLQRMIALSHDDFVRKVRVHSIDSYQGKENDIVILSLVRSTKLGFLRERRRLCVALTRARKNLVVIAHRKLPQHCSVLKELVECLLPQHHVYMGSVGNPKSVTAKIWKSWVAEKSK